MFNKVLLMGRLTRDPEFRQTQTGLPMCTFTIAIDRYNSGKNGTERVADFFRIVTWRNNAEFASKYFQKGSMVIVEGKIQNNDYTDQQGVKHFGIDVIADNVQFGETRAAAEARGLTVRSSASDGGYQGNGNYQGGNAYQNNYQNNGYQNGNGGYQTAGNSYNAQQQPGYQPIYANNNNTGSYPRGGDGIAYTGINNASEKQAPPPVAPIAEPVSNGSVEDFNEIMSDGDVPF
jgi:single-strand DNA-binding protein